MEGTEVETAYRKLKSYVYYDKTDLRLRARLAAFECSEQFVARLKSVQDVADAETPANHAAFKRWLKNVGFRVVPKRLSPTPVGVKAQGRTDGRFITNVSSARTIGVEAVNYFFDGPIELHLIAVLWLMREGLHLDAQLAAECCGSRLSTELHDEDDDSLKLFSKYHEQYARWRDSGIRKAKQLLVEEQRNVAILGLDLQEYFYRVSIDFEEVADSVAEAKGFKPYGDSSLLGCIEAIGRAYRKCISPLLLKTHPDLDETVVGLPIGLCSSLVLANWYLQDFDAAVLRAVRPAYYGRYVDDILLVVPTAQDPTKDEDEPVASFVRELLVRPRILTSPKDGSYELCSRPGLRLQQTKCILQYFDARHSIAGLEKFKKKLEENGSDFLLLPVDEADNSMEDVAYELLYEGSVNKFRSVKGVAENRYELAKHLARQTILHLVTDDPPDRQVSRGLQMFFKGRNAIEFFDLWERVFTLLGIARDKTTLKVFTKQLKAEIARVRADDAAVTDQLVSDLSKHLNLALAMSDAVCEEDIGLSELIDDIHPEQYRRANLLRHHFVRAPLLNFTTYSGPLSDRKLAKSVKLDAHKLAYAPRFVNFDECMLLAYSGNVSIGKQSQFEFAAAVFEAANRHSPSGVKWIKTYDDAESESEGN
ncbi:RNA-directed DNA polymerase [Ralstonia holmesii]|uniref:RNA-directed DNA polymerase n=1 Tax=Ralstonia holmesii TaxID=3058602 RepID=UPI00292E4A60|nr:RNA-directed DNA polymerase [Ralstonia sp. LMG 32967]